MKLIAKTTALAAAFLITGVAGASAQVMVEPEIDAPMVAPGGPTDAQPPGELIDERRAGSPEAFGSGAGGGVVMEEPAVGVVPAIPPGVEEPFIDED